ncbi:hypothetical protein EZ456_22850 [Pedobacter psychrodurus]|uniref:Uncharacterized protein n=1 Tax=Pedobacter psychrodurus TaxID=2530456 RepID=A0A4R0PGC8_9SPHI|nr:hypothetical protein [Pedobacter psychrodurus]TCD17458.1 hypothetical protein EZ456_22850 [Pedobacter psychrodurus]
MEKKRHALRKQKSKKVILKEKEDKFLDLVAEIIVNIIMDDEETDNEMDESVLNPLPNLDGSLEHNESSVNYLKSNSY